MLSLLGKGQSMLNLDDPHGAIACFDEVLTLEPKTLKPGSGKAQRWRRFTV